MKRPNLRSATTLIELLVASGILGLLTGLLLGAVQQVREAASRSRCANNLRQIGLALHQSHGAHGVLPPGVSYREGTDPFPFLSWNARLLPFLEQNQMWAQVEQAYAQTRTFQLTPPHLSATVLPIFGCPSDARTRTPGTLPNTGAAFTSYLGVEGTNQFRQDGVLFLDSAVRFADIPDGLSSTLLVGERPPSTDQRLGWWYAGWGQNQDGSAEMVLGTLERNFGRWATVCPPGPFSFGPGDLDKQCDAFHFWSLHPGGAHFLLGDGSVHLIRYTAASLMPAFATRAGGEVAELP